MALTNLTQFELLQGIFGLIFVIIIVSMGLKIVWKVHKLEIHELSTLGLGYILFSSAWWGVAAQFIAYGFFNIRLTAFSYLFISSIFPPIGFLCWIYSYCQLINFNLKRSLFVIILIFTIIWEVFLFTAFFTDNIVLIGSLDGLFDSTMNIPQIFFATFVLIIMLFTGLYISIKSIRSEKQEIKWKGRFLFLSFILIIFGSVLESIIPMDPLTLIIIRMMLIIGSCLAYIGWFLPEIIKKKLVKN